MTSRPAGAGPIATTSSRPVEVVRLRSRRPPVPPSAPLPEPVLAALASIAGDLRHLPRDCIGDPAELLVWLRRMAGRVDGVGRMRVPGVLPQPARPAALSRPAALRDLADAVFGKGPTTARAPRPRMIVTQRGRSVRVEWRRARDNGQGELIF